MNLTAMIFYFTIAVNFVCFPKTCYAMSTTEEMTTAEVVECSRPYPIANAYITTYGPYYVASQVIHECMSGYVMTGAPAQVCGEDGAWHGYLPVCTRLGDDPIRANDQAFDITLITGKDSSALSSMLIAGLFLVVVLALMFIAWLFLCRKLRINPRSQGYEVLPDSSPNTRASQVRRSSFS